MRVIRMALVFMADGSLTWGHGNQATPNNSAPCRMISRFTLAAKALSLSFFFTLFGSRVVIHQECTVVGHRHVKPDRLG